MLYEVITVEEVLRFDSPVQVLGRAVLDDTKIEGCPMHRGDRVVVITSYSIHYTKLYEIGSARVKLKLPGPTRIVSPCTLSAAPAQ